MKHLSLILSAIGIFIFSASEARTALELTPAMLFEGTTIPAKRDFPLSSTTKPCDNFYEYVCSEVKKDFKLPDDRSRWAFAFTDNAERILYAKKQYFKFIEKGYEPKVSHAKPIKNFYLACMNEKASATEENSIVAKELETVAAVKNYDDLLKISVSRYKTGQEALISFGQSPDQDDPKYFDAEIWTHWQSLPEKSYYQDEKVVAGLKKVLVKFFETLKFPNAEERANWVLDFEKGFAKVYPEPQEMRKRFSQNTYMSRDEWVKRYPHLGMKEMIALFPNKARIRNLIPESFDYVEKASQTLPIDQWKSVFLFHSLTSYMDDAYADFFQTYFAFNRDFLGGPKVRSERQERCTKQAMGRFPMELDEDLIKILFPNFPSDKVVQLVDKIRATIVQKIDHSEWLSPEGKIAAKQKISKADLSLVKPKTEDQWNFKPKLDYSATTPYANSLKLEQAIKVRDLKEMGEARHRDRWEMGPLVLNAYYDAEDNKFVLLQGILQYPFFDPNQNDAQNIGAIGVVIGHELGHSIDDQGSKYDYTGKLHTWMTAADVEAFKKRGSQFVDRFNKAGQNGLLTLGENIGDHVGITTAYQAAFGSNPNASTMDKQNFFVAYARLWCDVVRPDYEKLMIKTNPHPSNRTRVNEQVIHVDGFSEAYSCKAGDAMFVPKEDRIHVW